MVDKRVPYFATGTIYIKALRTGKPNARNGIMITKRTKRLTPRTALQVCIKLWDGLAETGDGKPASALYEFRFDCPCCQYVADKLDIPGGMPCAAVRSESDRKTLALCPLNKLWPDGCGRSTSPFEKWSSSNFGSSLRKRYARIIADGARKALAELKGKK